MLLKNPSNRPTIKQVHSTVKEILSKLPIDDLTETVPLTSPTVRKISKPLPNNIFSVGRLKINMPQKKMNP
jgi:hypothetical protein